MSCHPFRPVYSDYRKMDHTFPSRTDTYISHASFPETGMNLKVACLRGYRATEVFFTKGVTVIGIHLVSLSHTQHNTPLPSS